MPKSLGEKNAVSRVTRSLRNRVVSVDSDSSSRPATSVKNELDAIAENETEVTSPSTPTKNAITSKSRKRRSSQSEVNTPVKTPVRRLTRRTSLSEVENVFTASPLRRSTRKASALEENSQTPRAHSKSPISVNIVLEEDEEDKLGKTENLPSSGRVTRASSKSPSSYTVSENLTKKILKSSTSAISSKENSSVNSEISENSPKRVTRSTSQSPRIIQEVDITVNDEGTEIITSNNDNNSQTKGKHDRFSKSPISSKKFNKLEVSNLNDNKMNNLENTDDMKIMPSPSKSIIPNLSKVIEKKINENEQSLKRNSSSASKSPVTSSENSSSINITNEFEEENRNDNNLFLKLETTPNDVNPAKIIDAEMNIIIANDGNKETNSNGVEKELIKQTITANESDAAGINKGNDENKTPNLINVNPENSEKENPCLSNKVIINDIDNKGDESTALKSDYVSPEKIYGDILENITTGSEINEVEPIQQNVITNKHDIDENKGDDENKAKIISFNEIKLNEKDKEKNVIFTNTMNNFEHSSERYISDNCNKENNVEATISKSHISDQTKPKEKQGSPTKDEEKEIESKDDNVSNGSLGNELNTTQEKTYLENEPPEEIFENKNRNQRETEKENDSSKPIENTSQFSECVNENLQQINASKAEMLNDKNCINADIGRSNIKSSNITTCSSVSSCDVSTHSEKLVIPFSGTKDESGDIHIKQKSVSFKTMEHFEKSSVVYPKTPIFSKSKSYIEDDLSSSNEISDLTNLHDNSKHMDQECAKETDHNTNTLVGAHKTIDKANTPNQKVKKLSVSSSTPIVNSKQTIETIEDDTISEEKELKATQILSANAHNFSKSWSQAIICNTKECEPKFIDGLELDKKKNNVSGNKKIENEILPSDSDESMDEEKEEEEREKNDFIDDEAVEVEEYESMDSMDSEEREYLKNNEIPVQGESIGSNDTEDEESCIEGEENSMKSFIVSSNEESNASEKEFSSDDNNEFEVRSSVKAILVKSSDEENEETEIKPKKRVSRRAIVIESSDDENDNSKPIESENHPTITVNNDDCTKQENKEHQLPQSEKIINFGNKTNKSGYDLDGNESEIEGNINKTSQSIMERDAQNQIKKNITEKSITKEARSNVNDRVKCPSENIENIIQENEETGDKSESLHANFEAINDKIHSPNAGSSLQDCLEDNNNKKENDKFLSTKAILETINENNKTEFFSDNEKLEKNETSVILDTDKITLSNKEKEQSSTEELYTISKIPEKIVSERITDSVEKKESSYIKDSNEFQNLKQHDLSGTESAAKIIENGVNIREGSNNKEQQNNSSNVNREEHLNISKNRRSKNQNLSASIMEDKSKDSDVEPEKREQVTENLNTSAHSSKAASLNETFTSEFNLDQISTESDSENKCGSLGNEKKLTSDKNEDKKVKAYMDGDFGDVSQEDVKIRNVKQIPKFTENSNKKGTKRSKTQHLHPIEHLLNRCDAILEAVNQAKMKAKNTKSNDKKAKQKTSKKEYKNISLKSKKLLDSEANGTAEIIADESFIENKGMKRTLEIKNYSDAENHNERKLLARENKKHKRAEKVKSYSPKVSSLEYKNKKASFHKLNEHLTPKKYINFVKNSSGIFREEPITPISNKRKKLKITSTLELATGTVYEQVTTPNSERNVVGFQESEATPKSLGFKVKQVLSAGQKDPPVIKEGRVMKRKLILEDSTFSLPKPKWSTSGEFSVAKVENVYSKNVISLNSDKSILTDFSLATLQSRKRSKSCGQGQSSRAFDFKTDAFFNKKINRVTSKELLQRKQKQIAYNNF